MTVKAKPPLVAQRGFQVVPTHLRNKNVRNRTATPFQGQAPVSNVICLDSRRKARVVEGRFANDAARMRWIAQMVADLNRPSAMAVSA